MAINFPTNPSDGEVYSGYYYDLAKTAWRSLPLLPAQSTASSTPPLTASPGQFWFNTNEGILFTYFSDGTSSQWVEVKANSTLNSTITPRIDSLEASRTSMLATDTSLTTRATNLETFQSAVVAGTQKLPGSVVQVQEYRGVAEVSTTGTPVDLINITFTTKFDNSKLFLQYYTGQLYLNKGDTNPEIFFQVDGVDQGLDTDHIFYGIGTGSRPVATIPLLTSSVGVAGNHNVKVRGGSYNGGTITYNWQSGGTQPRRSRFIVMEVAQ